MKEKEYTRDEYVFLAKLYEKGKKYDEMLFNIKKFITLEPQLSEQERSIFKSGFKNVICTKRISWRILKGLSKKEEHKTSKHYSHLKELKLTVEKELKAICVDFHSLVDKYLLPNTQDHETKVFYLKLKADYYRYQAEFTTGSENNEAADKAEEAYKEAYEIADKNIPISNPIRLGLALNLSVFYYETRDMKEEACAIATNSFNEAMSVLDDLEKLKAKDTLLIIQLLKENILLWTSDMPDDEGEENEHME